jgi:hypothetical protein
MFRVTTAVQQIIAEVSGAVLEEEKRVTIIKFISSTS